MEKIIKNFIHLLQPIQNNMVKKGLWVKKLKVQYYQKLFIGIVTAFIITLLISPTMQHGLKEYKLGDIAIKDIKSQQDLLVEDEKSTMEKKLEAEKLVLPIYDYDPTPRIEAEAFIKFLLKTGEESKLRKEWESYLHIPLSQTEWNILEKEKLNPRIRETFSNVVIPILKNGIINDKNLLEVEPNRGIIIRDIQTHQERRDDPPFRFLDLKEAKNKLRNEVKLIIESKRKEISPLIIKIAENFLRPNLTFNKNETEARKVKAREAIHPVYFQIKRGEVILRRGDRVKEDHIIKINAIKKSQEKSHILSLIIGMGLLSFIFLASLYQFSTKNIRKISLSLKDLLFFSSTLVGGIILLKIYQFITEILGGEFISIPASSYHYLFPFSSGAMLIRIAINSEVAIVFSILSSFFSASLMGNQLILFIFIFIGSIIGAHKVAQCEKRSIILRAGLTVGTINLIMIFGFNLISENPFKMTLISDLFMGFLGGPLASVITLGITSVIESLFGYTTDIKLLELANMDNPILKDLVLQAPGTYHHSIITGTLVEAAAKSIAANPLLARVSAYYHDIGKLKKPLYFIENASGMENKHDHLSPSMSSLILISHVKDGVELARENHLGDKITNIIQQHHGTSLITYFYQKAKEKENPEMSPINEEDFRYPGPKPQTKEAGIVMLADAVEAASRTLTDPTPARIKSLVQRIINNIFLDGQLEECELTLKDLHNIEESFTRILTGIFHQRIDYPTMNINELNKKRNDEDLDSKSAKTYPFKLKKNQKSGHQNSI